MACLVVFAARLPRLVSLVRPNIIFIPVPSTFSPRVARHGSQRERARPHRACGWAVNSCLMHRCRLSVLADRLLRIGGDTFRSGCATVMLTGRGGAGGRRRRRSCCPWQRLCAVLGRPAALVGSESSPAPALDSCDAHRSSRRAPAQALICRRPIRGTVVRGPCSEPASADDRWLVRVTRMVVSLFGSRPCQPPPYVYISPSSPTPSPHRILRPSPHSRHRTPSLDSLTPSCMLRHLFHPTRPP